MAQIGAADVSVKLGAWQGMTTLSKTAAGQFLLLENCYVNSDATEIRMMPGFLPVIDPETQQREITAETTFGYQSTHIDAERPVTSALAGNAYYSVEASPTQSQKIWTKPGLLHCFEQVQGRWIIVGESDLRREPILNAGLTAFVKVVSYSDDGVNITLTLNEVPGVLAVSFNAVSLDDRLLLEGLTGSLATLLNDKQHRVSVATAGITVVLATTSGGVVAPVTGQEGFISRVHSNTRNPLGKSNDAPSDLTIWTALSRGDENEAPVSLVRPAHVANRIPDYGDATGNITEGNTNAATVRPGTSRRRSFGLPYRLVPHVAGNRLILAAPGYGCVLQAPVVIQPSFTPNDTNDGLGELGNSIYDRPRALGVPKAVVWEDPDKTPQFSYHVFNVSAAAADAIYIFGGSGSASKIGTYQFKFAYFDEGTGEQGLCSEPISVYTDGSSVRQGFTFWIYYPGYLLHESAATSINVYRTTKGGKTFYFDRTIPIVSQTSFTTFIGPFTSCRYGTIPESATTNFLLHTRYNAFYISDEELVKQLNPVPDVIEQMPMGCKAARTIRGFTFYGGALGDAGSRGEYFKGSATLEYGRAGVPADIYPEHDEITFMHTASVTTPIASQVEGSETWIMGGARRIPPAYSGQTLIAHKIAHWARKSIDLLKLVNTKINYAVGTATDYLGRIPDVRFSIRDTPIAESEEYAGSTLRNVPTYLKLPRARLQHSEPDNPHIVPAVNTIVLANEIDGDIEGIGDASGQAIVCTQSKSYLLAFSQSPRESVPDVADERFGCIAPNSMVSFEGGCAWISDRGPVAFIGGGVQWIGQSLEGLFTGEGARYRRDGSGMMRHSFACHDAERSLLYFGVFADRHQGTPLETKISFSGGTPGNWESFRGTPGQNLVWSKFPCDEILVYSYRTNSWSVWVPPQPITWMTRGNDQKGKNRVFVLMQDRRIYLLDDTWAQGDKEVWRFPQSVSSTFSTFSTATAHIAPWKGLMATVVRTATDGTKTIVGTATITSETRTVGNTDVGFDRALTVKAGDVLMIGARSMRLRTTFVNVKKADTADGKGVGIRYSMDSRLDVGGSGPYDAFVAGSLLTSRTENGIQRPSVQSLNADDPSGYRWIGTHGVDDPVRDHQLTQGLAQGQNHLVDITVIGNAQVRLQDLYLGVA